MALAESNCLPVGNHCSGRGIRKIQSLFAFEVHQVGQGPAGATDAAFDRAHGAVAHLGRLSVGKSFDTDKNQCLALFSRQLPERHAEIPEGKPSVMHRFFRQVAGDAPHRVFDLVLAPAELRVKGVAQDGEQPRSQIGAGLELVEIAPGLDHGILNQIIGSGVIARQAERERAHRRQVFNQFFARIGIVGHWWLSF